MIRVWFIASILFIVLSACVQPGQSLPPSPPPVEKGQQDVKDMGFGVKRVTDNEMGFFCYVAGEAIECFSFAERPVQLWTK